MSARSCSRRKPPLVNTGEQWQALCAVRTHTRDSHSLGNPTRDEWDWKVLVSKAHEFRHFFSTLQMTEVRGQVCAPNWLQHFPRREYQCDSFFLISFHPKCSFFKISCEDSSLQCDKFSNFVMEAKRKWNSLL